MRVKKNYTKFQAVNQTILNETEYKLDSSGSQQNHAVGPFEHGNKPASYIKMKNISDQVCDYQLFKKDHIQWN
jgi:hypothetical protein